VIALLALALAAADPAVRLAGANALYLDGDFEGAARAYEALRADGLDGPDLHLNLGNAYLRLGRRGLALASYERALRIDPGDADARHNLTAARAGNVDRLVGAAESSLPQRVAARLSDRDASALFAAAWIGLWAALAARRRAGGRARALLAAAAVAGAIASVGGGTVLGAKILDRRTPAAIVIAPATAAREEPSRALRPSFELHEGTRVRLLEAKDDLLRVRLENGLEGWIPAGDVEIL
jgi:tetratricopeptide (TPR) repeat protein